jgi:hypothetical protein
MIAAWKHFIFIIESQGFVILWAFLFVVLGFINGGWVEKKSLQWRRIAAPFLSFCMPVFLLWILYHNVLQNWWLIDDPCHLFYISQNGIYPAFFDPARGFSPINFTPWEPLSLGFDYMFFGFNPAPFYWHQMISLSILLLCAQVILLRFLSPFIAAFTLSLFVSSVPLCDAANHLMTRHYIEGLIFALISIYLFMKAQEKDNVNYTYGSAFFYLLACLAKEVYVPLIVIFIAASTGTAKERLKSVYPFLLVAVIYTLWRFHMLDSSGMLSAYPHIPVTGKDVLYLPLSIIKTMGWDSIWQLMMAGLLFMAFVLYILKNNWRSNAFILLLAICVIVPIMPVASTVYSRYLFLFSFVYFIGIGLGLQYLCETPFLKTFKIGMVVTIAVVSLMVSVIHVQKNVRGWQAYGKEISVEGKFLLYNNDPSNLIVTAHGHCYWAFSALRKTVLGLPQGASYCIRDCSCPYIYPDKQVWVNINGQLFKDAGKMEKETPEDCGEKRELKIDFSYTNGTLKWQFGPYREGKYSMFLKGWDSGLIQVKREGEMAREFDLENDYIIVKYESYDGWKTYSPVLKFDRVASHEGSMNWRR